MSGKVTLPFDLHRRPEMTREATAPGLGDALDEERAGSMADEGGVSGAYVERQAAPGGSMAAWLRERRTWTFAGVALLAVAGGVVGMLYARRRATMWSRLRGALSL